GRGGSAVVYAAFDRGRARYVALKVLDDAARDDEIAIARLEREARTGYAVQHPNVCRTYEHGRLDDGRPALTMELLRGETVRERLHRCRALPAEEAIEIAVQTLAGLDAAHRRGVIHRDVKPENVFLSVDLERPGDLRVKLLDFGVCRWLSSALDEQ